MCLDQPELFGVQLRALLRAAVHGDVRIMLPLVVTLDEVRRARELLDEAARVLEARGAKFRRDVPLGVMIETPAAAVSCDTFVNDVAFFSIGTNDLVQYTLAVDRGNANLAAAFTPLHPAVLKLIQRTVDTAHETRSRRRGLRRDGVAAAHGVRADRARRAPVERRAALGAARQANRARHFGRRGRRGGERGVARRNGGARRRPSLRRRLERRPRR